MGKYGTDYTGFGSYEGGVNNDKGSNLVATNSDGETALLFGPAALREIQAGVANGDFAIPPDAAGDTITEENPLPYWTFTDDDSAGAITCNVGNDAYGTYLNWTVAANTGTGKTATISRYVAVPVTTDRAYAFYPELTTSAATNTSNRNLILKMQFYDDALAALGTAITRTFAFADLATVQAVFLYSDTATRLVPPLGAKFAKLSIQVDTIGTNALTSTLNIREVRMLTAYPMLLTADRKAPTTQGPASIWKDSGALYLAADIPTTSTSSSLSTTRAALSITSATVGAQGNLNVTLGDLTVVTDGATKGNIGFDLGLYGSSSLTGPRIQLGGTNARLWTHSATAADVAASTSSTISGVLITKVTAGQPSTNINGTANTDAFADALRNGGIAVDTTNNRAYFYSGGWKYAALTTPSDSRLKEDITEISGALDTLRQLVPVAFKWKRPEAHGRSDAVADDGTRLGFIADQVATTDLAHWVETLGVDDREADLVDTTEVLAVNIPQNEMEALVVQALLDIDARLKALEER